MEATGTPTAGQRNSGGDLLSLRSHRHACRRSDSQQLARLRIASIPGRVFAFITVRRTTGPGTSCLRMRQIFIVYLWSAKIFNKSIIEICTQKMHRVSTQKMHIGSCFTKAWGVASCAAAQLQ